MQSHHTGRYVTVVILLLLLAGGGYYFSKTSKVDFGYKSNTSTPGSKGTVSSGQLQGNNTAPVVPVISKYIDISGCVASPDKFSVKAGTAVTFRNNDKKAHVISFSPQLSYVVPSGSFREVALVFATELGTRKYSCDGKLGVGMLVLTP